MKRRQTACVHYNSIFKLQLLSNALSVCSRTSAAAARGSSAMLESPTRREGKPAQGTQPLPWQPHGHGNVSAQKAECPAHTQHLIHHTAHHTTSPPAFLHGGWLVFTYIYTQSLFQAICGVLAKKFPEYTFVRSNTSVSTLTQ